MQRSLSFRHTARWLGRSGLLAAFGAASFLPALAAAPPAAAQTAATLFVSDATAIEGNDVVFTVTVSGTHPDTTITYGTLDDTAISGSDYLGGTGNLTVPSTASTGQFRIKTVADNMWEPDESFKVEIYNPTYGTIIKAWGTAVIKNDDPLPAVTVSNPSVLEGDSGTTNMVFDVGLTNPVAASGIAVRYQTADGSPTGGQSGTADADYQSTTGLLTWLPGTNNTQQVIVPVKGDLTHEGDETFLLTFNSPSPLLQTPLPIGTAIIEDDDPEPTIDIQNRGVLEMGPGARQVNLAVSLSRPTTSNVSFRFRTRDGTALAMQDYVQSIGTPITIPAGATTAMVPVQIIGDYQIEPDEAFYVELYDLSNAVPGHMVATVTILNDDPFFK